jgi:hypothetical protein
MCQGEDVFVIHNETIIAPYNLLSQYFDMEVAWLLNRSNHGMPRAVYCVAVGCLSRVVVSSTRRLGLTDYPYRLHQRLDTSPGGVIHSSPVQRPSINTCFEFVAERTKNITIFFRWRCNYLCFIHIMQPYIGTELLHMKGNLY